MTPNIHEINTVHKEKIIKLKCLLYTNSTSSVGYWREVVFVLTFFGLAACLVISLIGFVNDTCTEKARFNLRQVFLIDDVTSAQRWFPYNGAQLSLTCQQSQYGPEVITLAVTAKTLTSARGEAYSWRIPSPPANPMATHN